MNTMFSIALPFPNMVHLYVTVSMVDLAINLNVEPKYVEEYVDVDQESDAPPVCHEEEMVATNEYTEFRTETDDEFEEMDFDGCEYEVPSNTFTDLDMNAVDDIQEQDPIIVPMVTDNTKLYTRMICENKEMLQHMVKCFAIKSHAPYEVVESTLTKWVIQCKKSNEDKTTRYVHLMFLPFLVQRRRPLVQEPDQLEEVDQHEEEAPPMTQTQKQSEHSYISPVMMMSTFGTTYYDSGVGQSSDFGRGYYNSEVGQSSMDFGQQYYDLGSYPSSSYMHGHGRGRGEHNEYLYYEVPAAVPEQSDKQQQQENAAVPEQSDEQQQQENQEEIQQ
ncbi:GATA zinc finger domain-containing protein 10-like isoform X2 [Cucumis melo var. makuwa]|uniref:GATA zinc finger domain-containing protein 10-like isoform X2 n=1 Tax=Cucumis melo var. makuwa TaxID=1194695 RepID=A0A5D3DHR2_CUCMM|nr:GATA zinc finger domain-containing protein 10-like isoform X2 [Cucumis melo var. makuwa]